MQRLYFISFLMVASVLAGCTASANAQSENIKAAVNDTPTTLPKKPTAIASATPETVPGEPPATCPITMPKDPSFTPPHPYDSMGFKGQFWFGSAQLWTAIPADGLWFGLPENPEGFTQKIFWWSDLFSLQDEYEPELIVTGQRLDAKAPPLNASRATNAFGDDIGDAMLTGVDFPTLGCWKITGRYKGTDLSFVIWVAP